MSCVSQQTGSEVVTIAADLADPSTPNRLIAERSTGSGARRADQQRRPRVADLVRGSDPRASGRQIAVNFTAPFMLSRLSLPSLTERRGMLINIGSAITCVANSALGAMARPSGPGLLGPMPPPRAVVTGVRVCSRRAGTDQDGVSDAHPSTRCAPGERPDPILDNAAPWMTAEVGEVARRVGRLARPSPAEALRPATIRLALPDPRRGGGPLPPDRGPVRGRTLPAALRPGGPTATTSPPAEPPHELATPGTTRAIGARRAI